MKEYKQVIKDGFVYQIYQSTTDAWNALTSEKLNGGWRIGCYDGYENCIYKSTSHRDVSRGE